MQYIQAGFGSRFLAICLDWAVATLTTALFYPIQASSLGPSALRLTIFFLEVSLLTALTGSSFGQRVLRIRVLTWPDQNYLPASQVFIRTLLIVLVIPAVITDSDSRGFHDRVTKSMVVKIPR
jgi:uncharacterized RDD family membrane protein YckC